MKEKIKQKHIILWMIVSFLYSLFLVFGRMFEKYGYIQWDSNLNFLWIIVGTLLGIPLAYLFDKLGKDRTKIEYNSSKGLKKKAFIGLLILNYICYFIILLGVYPGFFVYDAQDELLQVITRNFSAHHPILHVLYLGGIIQAGYKVFGTYNFGILLFMLFQSLCFSYANARIISTLGKLGTKKWYQVITCIYLILFPTIEMMVLCSTKDSVFALSVIMWLISYYDYKYEPGKFNAIKLCFWAVCIGMLRNNAIYAMVVFLVVLLLYKQKKLSINIVIAIIIAVILNKGLILLTNATPGGKQEMLTVPIQQVSRLYTYFDGDEGFSDEEKQVLYSYIPKEYLEKYRPKVSDYLKYGFNNETYKADSDSFWKLWKSGLKKSPLCYINAWCMTSYGYWYPNATIDPYTGTIVFSFVYDESSYFGYETEQPGTRESKIQFIDDYFRYLSLEKVKEDSVLLALILSPGTLFWIYGILFVVMITNKKERVEIPYIYMALVWGTLLLGPIALPRYVFYLWYCLPIALKIAFYGKKGEK